MPDMNQHARLMAMYGAQHHRVIFVAFAGLLGIIVSQGCSLEERKSSGLRGHTVNFEGVEHGEASRHAPRYCKMCHGTTLQGGEDGQPSCYQCHGLNWDEIDPEVSRAPADHSIDNSGYMHHTGRNNPLGTCDNCHGANLLGDPTTHRPSCFLCHDQKW